MTHPSLPEDIVVFERGWLSSNNILLKGRDGQHALIDSGYATHANQTVDLVRQTLGRESLTTLANTHLHSDHCGGNRILQATWPELETLIPQGCAEAVQVWDENRLSYKATGQLCERFRWDDLLIPGRSVVLGQRSWQIHAAPGHDPMSVVLFEPVNRVLISADALWQNGFGVVFPELEGEDAFADVALTLDLIEQLEPRIVIPGHGPVFDDVSAALQRARQRLAAFTSQPTRHANHAAKVLLKFKLLELQHSTRNDLLDWAVATPYFSLVHAKHAPDSDLRAWVERLLDSLCEAGAAERQAEWIFNQ